MVDLSMPCIDWHGPKHDRKGYRQVAAGTGRRTLAHRHVWEQCFGPLASEQILHHECENPGCVNPAHLMVVTRAEHSTIHGLVALMQPAGVAAKKARTHCKHGHEYTPANTYMDGNARGCKACRKVNKQRYLAKLRRARA